MSWVILLPFSLRLNHLQHISYATSASAHPTVGPTGTQESQFPCFSALVLNTSMGRMGTVLGGP